MDAFVFIVSNILIVLVVTGVTSIINHFLGFEIALFSLIAYTMVNKHNFRTGKTTNEQKV